MWKVGPHSFSFFIFARKLATIPCTRARAGSSSVLQGSGLKKENCANRHEFRIPSSVNLVQIICETLLSISQTDAKLHTIWAGALCSEFPESSSRLRLRPSSFELSVLSWRLTAHFQLVRVESVNNPCLGSATLFFILLWIPVTLLCAHRCVFVPCMPSMPSCATASGTTQQRLSRVPSTLASRRWGFSKAREPYFKVLISNCPGSQGPE